MDDIQRKITALLERAAHPATNAAERAACQEKADAMMLKHKIERAAISWERPIEERRKPTTILMDQLDLTSSMVWASRRDGVEYEISGVIRGIRHSCLQFAGVKARNHHFHGASMLGMDDELRGKTKLVVVGYEEDIYYGQMVWNSAFQEILRVLYPGWSENLSMDANVFNVKNAGYSWPAVREMGLKNNAKDSRGPLTKNNAESKLRTAYKREAKRRGLPPELPKLKDPHHWRNSFVSGFNSNLLQRMSALKAGRESYFDGANLPALVQDEDAVKDLFNEHFPPPPPPTEEERARWVEEMRQMEEDRKNRKPQRIRYSEPRQADLSAWRAGVSSSSKIDLGNTAKVQNKKEIQ